MVCTVAGPIRGIRQSLRYSRGGRRDLVVDWLRLRSAPDLEEEGWSPHRNIPYQEQGE